MSDKAHALEAIRRLSEEATFAEIIEAITIAAAIRRGEEDVAGGRIIPHEELKKRISSIINKPE